MYDGRRSDCAWLLSVRVSTSMRFGACPLMALAREGASSASRSAYEVSQSVSTRIR